MQTDFESNVKVDPEEMNKAVKQEVEVALLRMTEKKMKVEMQLEQAHNTIKERDARIVELENIIRQLVAAQGSGQVMSAGATAVTGQNVAILSTNQMHHGIPVTMESIAAG